MPESAPRFTFASGNASKILALPVYALGALAALLVPRRDDLWVFGCGSGVGEGALPLYELARSGDPRREVLWLARHEGDVRAAEAHGIRTVMRSSFRGFWMTLRAQVIVVTHGFGDVNRFGTRGGFIVQLWHGIPLKLIHLDSPATVRMPVFGNSAMAKRMMRRMYRRAAMAIRLMPAASEVSAARLRTAFGLPADRVVVTGDPRDDVLSAGTEAARTKAGRALVFGLTGLTDTGQRVVLYAPTWRDGEPDPCIPSTAEWERIAAWLERSDSVLIVRPHPLGIGDYSAAADGAAMRLLPATVQGDITPVLPGVDLLITDFSSIAFDFSLTGRPIAFLAPDVEGYTRSRGLYEPYEAFSGGTETGSWPDLLELLQRADDDPAIHTELTEHSARLAERHHAFRDGNNSARVYSEIITRLKEHQ